MTRCRRHTESNGHTPPSCPTRCPAGKDPLQRQWIDELFCCKLIHCNSQVRVKTCSKHADRANIGYGWELHACDSYRQKLNCEHAQPKGHFVYSSTCDCTSILCITFLKQLPPAVLLFQSYIKNTHAIRADSSIDTVNHKCMVLLMLWSLLAL